MTSTSTRPPKPLSAAEIPCVTPSEVARSPRPDAHVGAGRLDLSGQFFEFALVDIDESEAATLLRKSERGRASYS